MSFFGGDSQGTAKSTGQYKPGYSTDWQNLTFLQGNNGNIIIIGLVAWYLWNC